jgi:hypothetical protein
MYTMSIIDDLLCINVTTSTANTYVGKFTELDVKDMTDIWRRFNFSGMFSILESGICIISFSRKEETLYIFYHHSTHSHDGLMSDKFTFPLIIVKSAGKK